MFSNYPLKFLISHRKFSGGFTLIELIVVFSVMVILSAIGIASYLAYSHSAQIDTNMKEFKTALFTARSRALSQIRDSSCFSSGFNGNGYELKGYQIVLCCSQPQCFTETCQSAQNSYELQAVYDYPDGSGKTTETCTGRKFTDPNITINWNKTNATYFFFFSINGAIVTNSSGSIPQAAFSAYGITKVASVSATGVIQ